MPSSAQYLLGPNKINQANEIVKYQFPFSISYKKGLGLKRANPSLRTISYAALINKSVVKKLTISCWHFFCNKCIDNEPIICNKAIFFSSFAFMKRWNQNKLPNRLKVRSLELKYWLTRFLFVFISIFVQKKAQILLAAFTSYFIQNQTKLRIFV